MEKIKIFYSFNKLIIEGLSETKLPQTYLLPAIVKKKGASIYQQDSFLEIKLPKYHDTQLVEILLFKEK